MKSLDLAVIFWNREERRLRLLWRLIFALVVLALVVGVVTILGGALGIGIYAASGGSSLQFLNQISRCKFSN